jgi:hypothetical protein
MLTRIFAGQHQLQLAGDGDRILKEGLKKIAHPVQQQSVGILLLDLHVVLHHWGQIVPIDGVVVGVAHRVLGQPLGNWGWVSSAGEPGMGDVNNR